MKNIFEKVDLILSKNEVSSEDFLQFSRYVINNCPPEELPKASEYAVAVWLKLKEPARSEQKKLASVFMDLEIPEKHLEKSQKELLKQANSLL